MTHRSDVARGRDIVARWCKLAEQRLEHLTELFETGRWRRYHSERAFLENIREARQAVETWRDLLRREASRENIEVDISWLGRTRVTPLPRGEGLPRRVGSFSLKPAPVPAEMSRSVLAAISEAIGVSPHVSSNDAPSVPAIDTPAFERDLPRVAQPALRNTLDRARDTVAVQDRYPLLRNVM